MLLSQGKVSGKWYIRTVAEKKYCLSPVNWAENREVILQFLNNLNHVKEKNVRKILEKLVHKENFSESNRDAAIMWALHGYFVPTHKVVSKNDALGKNITTKFTIKDSQESFLYIGKCPQELEDHLEYLRNQGQPIQPFILAVGDDNFSLTEICIFRGLISFITSCNKIKKKL
ncbi:hypothetical protein FQR65_LT02951 [Abscondita terminalis]|nr:hypothetical protein FQR65_LT02951 [Abscondita terminalis]